MKFYEKYYENNYEELITYYPRYYKRVFEMVEILKAFGKIADGLEDHIERTYLNNFICLADAKTIKIWEKMLGINYTKELSLDQRKRVVISRIIGYGHIGEPELRQIISNYTDNAVAIDYTFGVITIIIDGEVFDEDNLLDTILHRIPAHLALDMYIRIRRAYRQQFVVGYVGATGAFIKSHPVAAVYSDKKHINKAGGMYCHTHITSMLIR